MAIGSLVVTCRHTSQTRLHTIYCILGRPSTRLNKHSLPFPQFTGLVADLECFGLVVEILLSRCRAIDSIHVQNSPVQCWHFHHRKNWKPGEIMAMPICHTLISNAGMKSTASNFGADTRVLKKSKRSRKVEPFRKFQEYKVMVTPTFFTTWARGTSKLSKL